MTQIYTHVMRQSLIRQVFSVRKCGNASCSSGNTSQSLIHQVLDSHTSTNAYGLIAAGTKSQSLIYQGIVSK
ncbi:MAG TPA: hypothetical protein ACFYEH_06395 [Candidatus Brocadiaceae bacterium]